MIYKYKAFFTLSDDNTSCYVHVPALNQEFTLEQKNILRSALIRSATKEVEAIIHVHAVEGLNLPVDNPDYCEDCSFSAFLEFDTDKIAKRNKIVKAFDFSDEDTV